MASPGAEGAPVRPAVALALAVVGFFALAIFGLGMMTLIGDAEVIPVRGLSQIPGAIGMALATAAFAGALWWGLRWPHPSFWNALIAALAAYLGEVLGVLLGALGSGADPALAVSAAGSVAIGWAGAVIAAAALLAGWCGVGLVRTHAHRPRWPWERDDPDE